MKYMRGSNHESDIFFPATEIFIVSLAEMKHIQSSNVLVFSSFKVLTITVQPHRPAMCLGSSVVVSCAFSVVVHVIAVFSSC